MTRQELYKKLYWYHIDQQGVGENFNIPHIDQQGVGENFNIPHKANLFAIKNTNKLFNQKVIVLNISCTFAVNIYFTKSDDTIRYASGHSDRLIFELLSLSEAFNLNAALKILGPLDGNVLQVNSKDMI